MRRVRLFWLALLLFGCLAVVGGVLAQEDVIQLERIEPAEGRPGSELTINIIGRGFSQAEDVVVYIEGVEVLGAEVISDEQVTARILIPTGARPGPRTLIVDAIVEGTRVRVGVEPGFTVLSGGSLPPEQPLALFGVEPPEVVAGSEGEVRIFGQGFAVAEDLELAVEGVDVLATSVESDDMMLATIAVPEDAPEGPRAVILTATIEGLPQRASLEPGLLVVSQAGLPIPVQPAPTIPTSQPDGAALPFWAWLLLLFLFSGAALLAGLGGGALLGRWLTLRARPGWTQQAKLQWQLEAVKELPAPQRACQWACQASVSTDLLQRWQVTALDLTPLPVGSGTPQPVSVTGEALNPLNDLTGLSSLVLRESDLRLRLAPVVAALQRQVMAWGQAGQSPAAIQVAARMAGPVEANYGLYHCRQTAQGLSWGDQPLLKWSGSLDRPGGEDLGVIRGPKAGEPEYPARLMGELEDCLVALVSAARLRP